MTISVALREQEPPALVTHCIVGRWRQAGRIWPVEAISGYFAYNTLGYVSTWGILYLYILYILSPVGQIKLQELEPTALAHMV